MPYVADQNVRIYWDEQGQGEPILLIMGLGYTAHMWHRARGWLAEHFRTIAFDNRGVGRSDAPAGPYPIALMAADAAAVLDAAEVSRLAVVIEDHVPVELLQVHQPNTLRAFSSALARAATSPSVL